ncbi:hypothetical protein ACRN9F_02085 [Shewanella oncorhynchi]|uniref:hypothetical protein n=1 Tax=Shewanella oncorhynchi TaxID=2726434 RepID=UPI003D7B3ED8
MSKFLLMGKLKMEDEYYKEKVTPLTIVSNGKNTTLEVMTGGTTHPLHVRIFEDFTSSVAATKELEKKQTDSIFEFINENRETVKDGLEKLLTESEPLEKASLYIQEIFVKFDELASVFGVLVDILKAILTSL